LFFRRRRRFAENFRERVAKSAFGLEAAAVARFLHALASAHLAQRQSHAARTMISLESHSIMALELPPSRRRIDLERSQFFIRQAAIGRLFHFRTQTFD